MATSVVTPAPSQEEQHVSPVSTNSGSHIITKMQSGEKLVTSDWHHISHNKNEIKLMNESTQRFESGELVRFRGMVQDIMEPEYFSTNQQQNMCDEAIYSSPNLQLAERTPLLVTHVPFQANWFRDVLTNDSLKAFEHRNKRVRVETHNDESLDGNQIKESGWNGPDVSNTDSKQQTPVLAKLYYDQYDALVGEKLKLNDVVEMVGAIDWEDCEMDSEIIGTEASSWDVDTVVVPAHIPRLHVVWFRKIDLDLSQNVDIGSTPPTELPHKILARSLKIFDAPAAAVWMALLSMAEREMTNQYEPSWTPVVTPQETTLGCASLNLITSDTNACNKMQEQMYQVLSCVVPVIHTIDLAKDTLQKLCIPQKRNGRIHSTPLQLPKGATLIINAGSIQPGRLSPAQLEILQALQMLTTRHQLPYRFDGGISIPFEADYRVIVISTVPTRRIFSCTLQVKYDIEDGQLDLPSLALVRENLLAARSAGIHNLHHNNITMPRAVLERAQQDFLARRMAGRSNPETMVGESEFHRWLTLTRLQARSRRSSVAEIVDWEQALLLDDAMMSSLSNL